MGFSWTELKSVQELQHRMATERGASAAERKEDFPRLFGSRQISAAPANVRNDL